MRKYFTKYEFRWASIITIFSLLWTAFEYEMGWHDVEIENHRYYTFLFLIPLTLCYYLFFLDKRGNRFKKRFKFRHGFYSGLGLTILIALFAIPCQLLVHYLVSPDYIQSAQDYAISTGEMTELEAKNTFNIFNFLLYFPVVYFLFGIVVSAVLAATMQTSSRSRRRR